MKNNNFILYLHHPGLGHPGLEKVIHLPLLHLKIKKKQQNYENEGKICS